MKRDPEPRGELARYAYGYSDKKPGKAWWVIHGVMVGWVVYNFIGVLPS